MVRLKRWRWGVIITYPPFQHRLRRTLPWLPLRIRDRFVLCEIFISSRTKTSYTTLFIMRSDTITHHASLILIANALLYLSLMLFQAEKPLPCEQSINIRRGALAGRSRILDSSYGHGERLRHVPEDALSILDASFLLG